MEDNQNEDMKNPDVQLRSLESREKAYLRFINTTNTTVEILWVNFIGQYMRFKLLRRESYVDVDTFKTHPWIAQDVYTKDRMWLDKKFIYMPQTTREHLDNNPNLLLPVIPHEVRKRVCITYPLHSLRYACLLAVRNHFKSAADVDKLELPLALSNDLKKVILHRNEQLVNMTVGIAGFPQ